MALSKAEAAEALGVSVDFLEEHVMGELRVVRRRRRRLTRSASFKGGLTSHPAQRASKVA
jgi:hypothetical protein